MPRDNEQRAQADRSLGKRLTVALAIFAFLVMLLGAYVGGYFGLSQRLAVDDSIGGTIQLRAFRYQWAWYAFQPAVAVESKLEGVEILPSYTPPTP